MFNAGQCRGAPVGNRSYAHVGACLLDLPTVIIRGVGEWPSWLRVEVETRSSRPDCAGCGTAAWDHGQREVVLVDLPVVDRSGGCRRVDVK